MKPIRDKFILLFTPHSCREGRRMPPLGLLAISALLDKEGYDIRILHSYDKDDYEEVLQHLDKAICVGITSMTGYQIYDGLKFAKLVRDKNPSIPIIWGGIHPTIKPIQTVEHPLVDIVVKGPGEDIFTELVHRLDKKISYDDVLGITYKKGNKIIDNNPRPFKSINEYPALPYHLLNDFIARYIKKNEFAKRSLSYITSMGCPFLCAFCYLANPYFSRKWEAYSAERVLGEIEYLVKKYDLDGIDIRDSNFFVDIERVRKICRGLIEKGLNIVLSGVNGRTDQLVRCNDQDWQLFKDAGIKEILIGAESGDQDMLNLINKQNLVENTLQCEKMAKKYGINIFNSFMTSFPPLTDNSREIARILKRELDKTVDLIRRIFEINPIANIVLFWYTPYFGTPLYELALKRGLKDPDHLEEWGNIDLTHSVTPWTSKKHIRKVLLLRILIIIKKITSKEYTKLKTGWKDVLFKKFGLYLLLNWWVSLRLKHKFYFFPFEKTLFLFNKLIK